MWVVHFCTFCNITHFRTIIQSKSNTVLLSKSYIQIQTFSLLPKLETDHVNLTLMQLSGFHFTLVLGALFQSYCFSLSFLVFRSISRCFLSTLLLIHWINHICNCSQSYHARVLTRNFLLSSSVPNELYYTGRFYCQFDTN